MNELYVDRPVWKDVLDREGLLQLPVAHDGLTAQIIERLGFPAYQIGGFALVGAQHGVPDIDLEHFGEKLEMIRPIIHASRLPVMVDADDGYGDAKNVTRTVKEYEMTGASGLFIEDQRAPAKCGHMPGKKVVPPQEMVNKVRAAVAARKSPTFFIMARTDAIQMEGLDSAIDRGKRYLDAGADGVYVEGPTSKTMLERLGREFRDAPLATSVLENGGVTPWLSPSQFREIGFNMILYPTTVLFSVAFTIQKALENLKEGNPLRKSASVNMKQFEEIVDFPYWMQIQEKFGS